jgi:hypothetical protein
MILFGKRGDIGQRFLAAFSEKSVGQRIFLRFIGSTFLLGFLMTWWSRFDVG